jgi:hypothetical protein
VGRKLQAMEGYTYDPEKAAAEPAEARTTAAENFMMT